MKKTIIKKNSGLWAVAAVLVATALTFSVSSVKFAVRYEYTLRLSKAEHFTFSLDNCHNFEIPSDG